MYNEICKILGIEYPIIQGAMAWTSTASLVAAVSNAGGLGVLGVGFAPKEIIQQEIRQTKELTDKPFAINVFVEHTNEIIDRVTEIAVEEKVPVIYADTLINFDYELTKKYIDIWHLHGMKVVVKVGVVADAITADRAGADIIITKGWEAGGHVAYEATMVLVPMVVDAVSCPVVAGGGIADGRGVVAVHALGAKGIELGTAFLVAEECSIHPNAKQAILDGEDMQTVVTGSCTDEPSRQIRNALSDELVRVEAENTKADAADKLRAICGGSLRKGMVEGDMINGAVMVGQNMPMIKEILPTKTIIERIIHDAREVYKNLKLSL